MYITSSPTLSSSSVSSVSSRDDAASLRAATGAWDPVELHDVASTRIAVARSGRGLPLVCLHATGHGARDFEALASRVGDAFEVIAVDWPGQGRSPREKAAASALRYSHILEELLPRIVDGPALLLGCSIGGAAAIELAARRPDLVKALVLCDPGGLVKMDAATRFVVGRMRAFFEAGARGASWFPAAFALYYRVVLPRPAAREQRERIVAACVETAPVLAEAWASFGAATADLRPLIPKISCPTLFAWASQDRVIPWRASRKAAESFANFRVEFFRAGHAAFLEDPERFDVVLRDFATSLAV